MAKTVSMLWLQGQTYRCAFVWARSNPESTEAAPLPPLPRDITGCTARMQLRAKYGTDVLLELTTENGGLVVGGADGRIQIIASAEQTDALGVTDDPLKPRRSAKYDLELVWPSGDVTRVIEGDITLSPNITRDAA